MYPAWWRWRRFSLCWLTSLVLCLSLHAWSTALGHNSAVALERQSSHPKNLVSLITNTDNWLGKRAETGFYSQMPNYGSDALVEKGVASYQAGKFTEAIALWEQALSQITVEPDRAIILQNLALAYQQIGQLPVAIAHWEKAIKIYRSIDDKKSRPVLVRLLTEQAQTYSELGQQPRAIALLQSAQDILLQNPEPLAAAAVEGALGNAYLAVGKYEEALTAQQNSLNIARELHHTSYIATALNNLGNIYTNRASRYATQAQSAELEGNDREANNLKASATQDRALARKFFEQSIQTARSVGGFEEVRALMNLNRLLLNSSDQLSTAARSSSISSEENLIAANWQRVKELLDKLPDAREKAYTLINLATEQLNVMGSREEIGAGGDRLVGLEEQPATLLEQALVIARNIGDKRAESFALGSLGQWHEATGEYDKSMELTRQAQFTAQSLNAPDSLYRWQWQAGRMLKARGATGEAIAAYEEAIASLQNIRGDLVAANQDVQLDFREQVEPVYRELMELLLDSKRSGLKSQDAKVDAPILKKAIDILELLKLAELENFFGDECVQVAKGNVKGNANLADAKAAVIYSIILDSHTEMILRSPDGSLTNYPVAITKSDLESKIDQLRYFLELQDTEEYLPQAQEAYDLLIRPMAADLAKIDPSTLIFINDGVLRKVPMAVLHDGQNFAIEKYPIANTPSLTLTNRQPLERNNLEALSLGLTIEKPPFAPLTNVKAEIVAVEEILGGIELVDGQFTLANLQAQLQNKSYPIVHIATHGKFGVDALGTFVLAYDRPISIEELDTLLRSQRSNSSVKLLTLSACQTAAGDDRSALGMAGVAVRAGVETALATLWYINDEATVPLIEEFYRQLRQPDITRAEALRRAQLKMIADINYNHPAVWSPFILIGNWL
ncbi:MAG TPA: hypothetical protein DC064_17285 [Cyanobacteria bacterium UBA9273]|nr:hypothetical protein [Cyanobacteria bacterium UBA9273]